MAHLAGCWPWESFGRRTVPREVREVEVRTPGGEEPRTGRRKHVIGIWVPRHEIQRGSYVLLDGTSYRVVETIRSGRGAGGERRPLTLIVRAERL